MDGTRDSDERDRRSGGEGKGSERPLTPGSPRARWTAPRIVHHGSIRHLVRGISGFLTDTFGMPGMRKV